MASDTVSLTEPPYFHIKPGESNEPTLSIIVVSYETRQMTLDCIASVKAETRTPFEIIVVDNASTDGSATAIAENHPDVVLLAESTNHGFGPAHDIALANTSAPWVLLLNPDTVVLDRALDKLLTFANDNPDAGIWGGRTLYADGSLNPTSCFGKMPPWSLLCRVSGLNGLFWWSQLWNSEYYGSWARDTEREVDIISGCFFLIKRQLWNHLRGFNRTFAMYGEEVDLCLRARALGARPMITPAATIIHHGGASERVEANKLVRVMRAKVELIRRHFPRYQRRLGLAVFRLLPLSRRIYYQLASKIARSEIFAEKARNWSEVWARRREWQRGFPAEES